MSGRSQANDDSDDHLNFFEHDRPQGGEGAGPDGAVIRMERASLMRSREWAERARRGSPGVGSLRRQSGRGDQDRP